MDAVTPIARDDVAVARNLAADVVARILDQDAVRAVPDGKIFAGGRRPDNADLVAQNLVAVGTLLDVDSRGGITGRLVGRNCRGPEKVARLREHFGRNVTLAAAYGDSSGDREMLAMAAAPGLRVFSGRP